MGKQWVVSPAGSELRLVADDGFKCRVIPNTEEEILAALNAYEEQVQSLLREID